MRPSASSMIPRSISRASLNQMSEISADSSFLRSASSSSARNTTSQSSPSSRIRCSNGRDHLKTPKRSSGNTCSQVFTVVRFRSS